MPHIHTEAVLKDIEHWQDEKEANFKAQRAIREKLVALDAKKYTEENATRLEAEKAAAAARTARK